jgi:DNA mismatch endonuclease (patch repair protein)
MDPIEAYISELRDIRLSGAGVKETSYYPALRTLHDEIGKALKPRARCTINPRGQGPGLPDAGLFTLGQFQKTCAAQAFFGTRTTGITVDGNSAPPPSAVFSSLTSPCRLVRIRSGLAAFEEDWCMKCGRVEVSYDPLSPAERSERMSRVRSKGTKPEGVVRRLATTLGYRYRLHNRKLPGSPDLVFPGRKKVIFVHGCFWHQHKRCRQYQMPRSRLSFWLPKLEGNRLRDRANKARLRRQGWGVLVIWECQLKKPNRVSDRIVAFLEGK